VICSFDTDVLIWALKQDAPPGKEDLLRRAKLLFRMLNEQKAKVVVHRVLARSPLA